MLNLLNRVSTSLDYSGLRSSLSKRSDVKPDSPSKLSTRKVVGKVHYEIRHSSQQSTTRPVVDSPPQLYTGKNQIDGVLSGCKSYIEKQLSLSSRKSALKVDADILRQRIRDDATKTLAAELQKLQDYRPSLVEAFHQENQWSLIEESST